MNSKILNGRSGNKERNVPQGFPVSTVPGPCTAATTTRRASASTKVPLTRGYGGATIGMSQSQQVPVPDEG